MLKANITGLARPVAPLEGAERGTLVVALAPPVLDAEVAMVKVALLGGAIVVGLADAGTLMMGVVALEANVVVVALEAKEVTEATLTLVAEVAAEEA